MSLNIWHKIIPAQERQWLQSSERPVLHDCLQRLEYHQRSFSKALLQFREELVEVQLLPASLLSAPQSETLAEKHLAEKLLSLEGDFPIQQLPAPGAKGLWVRILHYRLQLLGLYTGAVRAPFSADSLAALQQLGQWLNLAPDSNKLLQLTGHFIPLLHRLKQEGNLSKRIVTFQLSPSLIAPDIRKDLDEERGITEKDPDLQKKEHQALRELEALEEKILGREQAELQVIQHRRQNKAHSLKRLSNLRKATHALLRQLWQNHLKAQRIEQRERKKLQRKLEIRQILIEQMRQTYEELEDVTKRRKLRKQIKAREKVMEKQEDKFLQKQKKWARRKKRREKSIARQQKDLRGYQEDIKRLRARINGLRFRFKGQLKRSLTPSTFREVQREVFHSDDLSYLQALENDAYNAFLIRILQISQWVNGYYIGKIDSQFAGKTFGAIVEMVEDLPRLRLKYILSCLPKEQEGYWVLNIDYLFERFCKIYPVNEKLPSPDEVLEQYGQAFISSDPLFHTPATEACWEEWEGPQLADAYHGRNRLWASMAKVVKKLAALVWRGVKATAQIFRNFIRLLYEDIRESVILFAQSLDFLFGKRRTLPLGEEEEWTVKAYQYDPHSSLSENIEAAQAHFDTALPQALLPAQKIQESLAIIRQIAKWALALAIGTINWPQLLLKLVLFCRKWFFRWLRELLLQRRNELFSGLSNSI